jgi:hypothetical protein
MVIYSEETKKKFGISINGEEVATNRLELLQKERR